ncbi:acyltransferase family-domain-containing protein [Nemania sp. NC0429]|nr:acyltransferase family-domain-containing protein [Nemania sp. NC0429]
MPPARDEKCRHTPLMVANLRPPPLKLDAPTPGGRSNIWGDVEARLAEIPLAATMRTYLGLVLRRLAVFILPSFTPNRVSPARERRNTVGVNTDGNRGGGSGGAKKALSPTAYLDGMRGVAALFVFFCHYFYTAFVVAEGYLRLSPPPSSPPDSNIDTDVAPSSKYTSLWRLPFVRLLYSGPSMVCVFFVISGYALSLRPLRLARSSSSSNRQNGGEEAASAFARTMSSLVFRRFFRLYLPPLASTLGTALLVRAGVLEGTRAFVTDRRFVRNIVEHHPPRLGSTPAQLAHWAREMWALVHVWSWADHAGSTVYDVHLWTIPVEFRCSMVLFLVLVGTARLRGGVRLAVVALLAWFVLRSDRWEMLLFLAGMAIADLDVRRNAHDEHELRGIMSTGSTPTPVLLLPLGEKKTDPGPSSSSSPPRRRRPTADSFWTLVSVSALYLLSCPDAGPWDVPGWRYLGTLIPSWFTEKYRFLQVVGACLFVFCAARSRGWQRVFETAAVQYLGHLSYAVYLMHGPVMHVLGYPVQRWAWGVTGIEDPAAYKKGVVLAAAINIPLVIWAADVFWRAVDIPSVRFAKWLESKLSV